MFLKWKRMLSILLLVFIGFVVAITAMAKCEKERQSSVRLLSPNQLAHARRWQTLLTSYFGPDYCLSDTDVTNDWEQLNSRIKGDECISQDNVEEIRFILGGFRCVKNAIVLAQRGEKTGKIYPILELQLDSDDTFIVKLRPDGKEVIKSFVPGYEFE